MTFAEGGEGARLKASVDKITPGADTQKWETAAPGVATAACKAENKGMSKGATYKRGGRRVLRRGREEATRKRENQAFAGMGIDEGSWDVRRGPFFSRKGGWRS